MKPLAVAFVVAILVVVYFLSPSVDPLPSGSSASQSREEPAAQARQPQQRASGPASEPFTLSDGSKLEVENVRATGNWACGTLKAGTLKLPTGQRFQVVIYLDRAGSLVTVNAAQGNTVLYDETNGRQCLMNWKTNQMELLTEEEYARFEREAGQ